MFKLLLVDDEPDILNGMANGIPWALWGFEVVGKAKNGLEALEFIEKERPHVVLSDIRMPQMDGLQLMKKLNQTYPDIKLIILSGYSDVEYLKEAIKNHVAEYLLKPTDLDEFETTFMKIRREIEEEQRQEEELEDLKQMATENRDYKYTRILNDLIRGYAYDENYLTLANELGINFKKCLIVVCYPHNTIEESVEPGGMMELRKRIIRYINYREDGHKLYFFESFSDQIVGIVSLPDTQQGWKGFILRLLQELQYEVQDLYGVELAAGVSEPCKQVSRLYNCYEQAVKCAHQKIFLGTLSIVLYPDLETYGKIHVGQGFDLDKIKQCMENCDRKGLENEIDIVLKQFENQLIRDYSYVDRITLECLYAVSRWGLSTYQIRLEDLMEEKGKQYFDIRAIISLRQKGEFLLDMLMLLAIEIKENRENGKMTNSLAQVVKDYVDAEYCSNLLSLDLVAERVKKNAAYLSKLFKRETGYNFSDYITKKRIEKSKELLKDHSLKIYNISEMIGYADVSNFIKVFKKNCGVSPSEYRNTHGGNV